MLTALTRLTAPASLAALSVSALRAARAALRRSSLLSRAAGASRLGRIAPPGARPLSAALTVRSPVPVAILPALAAGTVLTLAGTGAGLAVLTAITARTVLPLTGAGAGLAVLTAVTGRTVLTALSGTGTGLAALLTVAARAAHPSPGAGINDNAFLVLGNQRLIAGSLHAQSPVLLLTLPVQSLPHLLEVVVSFAAIKHLIIRSAFAEPFLVRGGKAAVVGIHPVTP